MGYTTLERMKSALLTATVTSLERTVLLDMAIAVDDDAPLYTWGHDRLALAIGKRPGSPAAKQALSVRILPSLIAKGLIRLHSKAHRGHRAEYELLVLEMGIGACSEMGNGSDDDLSRVTHVRRGMGNGSERQWVTVSEGMGNAKTVTPLPTSLPSTPPSRVQRFASHDELDDINDVSAIESGGTPSVGVVETGRSDSQVSLLCDLHIFATRRIPSTRTIERFRDLTSGQCTEAISTYWRQIDAHGRGPAYDGPERGDRTYEHLSARGQQWADVALVPTEMSP
ncbi:hypothetical protein [Microbacterium sp. NPDC055357]